MKPAALALSLALLALAAAPPAAGSHPSLTVVAARLDYVFAADTQIGPHFRIEMTLRNDGEASWHQIRLDEYGWITDLPFTLWSVKEPFGEGEERSFIADIAFPFPEFFTIPGVWWICLDAGGWHFGPERCWSVWYGSDMPNGVFPENIPNWQVLDVPMGDTE